MIKIDTSGVAEFNRLLSLEMARLDREISDVFYKWTARIFYELVNNTPQWSGDLAANWNYSLHAPDMSYTRIANKTGDEARIDYWREDLGVFQRGHQLAVGDAMSRMKAVPRPTWRDTVYFTNATPIADDVEEGRVNIRPVNLVQGQVAMIAYTVIKENQRGTL